MTPANFTLVAFFSSIAAGLLGSLLGLGGGIIVVPVLTLFLGVDIRYAVGASVVSVIATSSGSAAAYVKEHLANIKVAMFLELGTTAGALTGAYVGGLIAGRWLYLIFAIMMGYSAVVMVRSERDSEKPIPKSRLADKLGLHDTYYDEAEDREIPYRATRPTLGLAISYVAGIVSGLLGIGGGALKVPAMALGMRMPIKVCTATSNFMIGVTAAASAGVYFARGDINPFIAAPVALGVLSGATFGAKILGKLQSRAIRIGFVFILFWISAEMLWHGFHT